MYGQAATGMAAVSVTVYAGYSCGSCHRGCRAAPNPLITGAEGGSGSYGFSSMLVYISAARTVHFFQDYGRVLHDQAIYGVQPEGKHYL